MSAHLVNLCVPRGLHPRSRRFCLPAAGPAGTEPELMKAFLRRITRSAECHAGGNKHSAHLTINVYGYDLSLAAGIVFLVVFSLLTIAHVGVLAKSRVWWTVVS